MVIQDHVIRLKPAVRVERPGPNAEHPCRIQSRPAKFTPKNEGSQQTFSRERRVGGPAMISINGLLQIERERLSPLPRPLSRFQQRGEALPNVVAQNVCERSRCGGKICNGGRRVGGSQRAPGGQRRGGGARAG